MGGHRHDDQLSAFVGRHALDLHRTARMLTGDTDRADVLTAQAVRRAAGTSRGPGGLDEARAGMVQDFLRTAHRHRWERPSIGGSAGGGLGADAGEIVAGMPPRERAASVLGLVHGWAPAQVARAVGVRTRKVASQISSVPGVRDALAAAADRYDTSERDLVETLLADLHPPPESPVTPAGAALPASGRLRSLRGHWRLTLLAALVLLLAGTGWALTHGDPRDPAASTVPLGTDQSMPESSLAWRGWELDAKGKAPTSNEGLRLLQSVTIDYRRANAPLELMGGNERQFAKFAVLWCDLPAVDDPHLVIPALTLTFDEGPVTLPCAGRQGQPPVTRLTPTPFGLVSPQDARVAWTGDLPGRGEALLAFYYEVDGADVMLARGAARAAQGDATEPAVPAGSVPVTKDSPSMSGWWGRTYVQKVEITHDSAVSAWAGSSAALIVTVDGQPLTDDGDLSEWNGITPADLWHQQDPMLRDGAWLVYGPDQARTFALPDTLRPAPGERRTVVVTTLVQDSDEVRWQVQVSDATAIPHHTTSIEATSGPGLDPSSQAPVPHFVGGYRFVARWDIPTDGYPYDLEPPGRSVESALFMTALDTRSIMQIVQGPYGSEGSVQSEFGTAYLSFSYQLIDNFSYPGDAWGMPPEGQEPGRLRAALQALPGQPMAPLWAFEPVPYEDFDFTDAPPLSSSWPAHEDKPHTVEGQRPPPLGHGTLKDGVVTLEGEGRPRFALVTTQGKGRLRMLIGGQPIEELEPHREGWWSSWTEEPVTSELYLGEAVGDLDDLTIEVEGYDEGFAIELFPDSYRR